MLKILPLKLLEESKIRSEYRKNYFKCRDNDSKLSQRG